MLSLTENTLKLSLPFWASEVYFVSEVILRIVKFRLTAKIGANLTSLVHSTNFTATQLHFRGSENFTDRKKRGHFGLTDLFSLSACNTGLGLAHKVFDRSNAMLALSGVFQILR